MTQESSPAHDPRLAVERRLAELEGYGQTGLVEPGAEQLPVAFWVPNELLTNRPSLVVAALAKRGVQARTNPNACAEVYRVEIDSDVCDPRVAEELDEIIGDLGWVGLNHVLTIAQVPKIGPGTDPEPIGEADWGCEKAELPEDWQIAVVDTGLFKGAPSHLGGSPANETELVDFNGDRIVDFSGTAHGGFIAGIFYRMLGVAPVVRDVATRDYAVMQFAITEADIIADIDFVLHRNAVKVVNLSLGAYERGTRLVALRSKMRDWIERHDDVLFVCAAGNDHVDLPFYPAAFAIEPGFEDHVVSVGALDCSPRNPDAHAKDASFSNYGGWVVAHAPGVDHDSDYACDVEFVYGPQDAPNPPRARFDGLARWSGTSFAAPYAAAEITRFAITNAMTPRAAWSVLRKERPVRFPLGGKPCYPPAAE